MEKKVKIKDIVWETSDAITIRFENDPVFKGYVPGQFINITKEVEKEMISRSYSFSSSPYTDPFPAVTIKKILGGKLSELLVGSVKEDSEILISEPMGRFALNMQEPDDKHLIFIAGGSGITPLYAMIKTALFLFPKAKVTLLYGSNDASSIIFKQQLDELMLSFEGTFNVLHFLVDSADSLGVIFKTGYIINEDIKRALNRYPGLTNEIYLCGPQPMMDSVTRILNDLKFDVSHLYQESYGLPSLSFNNEINSSARESSISIEKGDERIEFTASSDDFILNTAFNKGIRLPHSCKEALCGACKVKILSGQVTMTENYALTDNQLSEGYVLLCTGKPGSDKVELTYN